MFSKYRRTWLQADINCLPIRPWYWQDGRLFDAGNRSILHLPAVQEFIVQAPETIIELLDEIDRKGNNNVEPDERS